ncbi:PREDICTED: uncharacterized protein LOC105967490 isoform X1 [Erythranthe guttata]|uniref:uncharacterized protein LOC105967490 isoform X1 n=1 Tax=Erythranthe guttata TaxID=4155 RepID=UPI00064DC77E|nr:PREDICTED: uncharacterized protein LOC105967490 isoform X1 [Erythranthe guttata]|eukprot:XP_012847543.1 PREDICTED: uncharacterized protein LOC105967490 isoform X1 [Erythranthe guttata]
MVSGALKSLSVGGSIPDSKGEMVTNAGTTEAPKVNKGKAGPEPIIIPIILKMAEFDHKALLEEWVSARSSDKYPIQVGTKNSNGSIITLFLTCQLLNDNFVKFRLDKVPSSIVSASNNYLTNTIYFFFQGNNKLIGNLKTIQDYLCSFKSQV